MSYYVAKHATREKILAPGKDRQCRCDLNAHVNFFFDYVILGPELIGMKRGRRFSCFGIRMIQFTRGKADSKLPAHDLFLPYTGFLLKGC